MDLTILKLKKIVFLLIIIFPLNLLGVITKYIYNENDANKNDINIVIFPFRNAKSDQDSSLNWMGSDLARMLKTSLSRDERFKVLYRENLSLLSSEKSLYLNDPQKWVKKSKEDTLKEKGLIAEYYLLGSYRSDQNLMRIDAILIDGSTTEIIIGEPKTFKRSEYLNSVEELGTQILIALDRNFAEKKKKGLAILYFKCENKKWSEEIFNILRGKFEFIFSKIRDIDISITSYEPKNKMFIKKYNNNELTSERLGQELGADLALGGKISIEKLQNDLKISIKYSLQSLRGVKKNYGGDYVTCNLSTLNSTINDIILNTLDYIGIKDNIEMPILKIFNDASELNHGYNPSPVEMLSNGIRLYERNDLEDAQAILKEAQEFEEVKRYANFYLGEIEGKRNNFFRKMAFHSKSVQGSRFYLEFEAKYLQIILTSSVISADRGDIQILNITRNCVLPKFFMTYKYTPNISFIIGFGFWYHDIFWGSHDPFEYSHSGTILDFEKNQNLYNSLHYNYKISHNSYKEIDLGIQYFFLPEFKEREVIPYVGFGIKFSILKPMLKGSFKYSGSDSIYFFKNSNFNNYESIWNGYGVLGLEYYISEKRPSIFGDLAFYFHGEIITDKDFDLIPSDLNNWLSNIKFNAVTFSIGIKTSEPLFLWNLISDIF